MFEYAINNETMRGANLPPFLTFNPYYEDMSIMAKVTLTKICSKCKIEKGDQLRLFG